MDATAVNIKRIIAEKGLKQSYVAKKAGYSIQQFNRMVNGRQIIKSSDIIPIAKVLDVEPNDIFMIPDEQVATTELDPTG